MKTPKNGEIVIFDKPIQAEVLTHDGTLQMLHVTEFKRKTINIDGYFKTLDGDYYDNLKVTLQRESEGFESIPKKYVDFFLHIS